MTALTAILTAVSILSHALLGCCAHHGHTSPASARTGVGVVAQECCGCGHQAAESAADEQAPSQRPADHDGCDESPCVFAPGGKVDFSKLWSASGGFPLVATLTSSSPLLESIAPAGHLCPRGRPASLRPHLAKHVLLI